MHPVVPSKVKTRSELNSLQNGWLQRSINCSGIMRGSTPYHSTIRSIGLYHVLIAPSERGPVSKAPSLGLLIDLCC